MLPPSGPVRVTGHQAFLTEEALTAIAETTLQSIDDAAAGGPLANELKAAAWRHTISA